MPDQEQNSKGNSLLARTSGATLVFLGRMRKKYFGFHGFLMSSFLRTLTIVALFSLNALGAQQQNDPPAAPCQPSNAAGNNLPRRNCEDQTFVRPPKPLLFPPLKKDVFAPSSDSAVSQPSTNTQKPDEIIKCVIVNIPKDQITIWTRPFHIRQHDRYCLATFTSATSVLLR